MMRKPKRKESTMKEFILESSTGARSIRHLRLIVAHELRGLWIMSGMMMNYSPADVVYI